MVHVQRIDSLELPELAPYRTMRRQMEHRQEGIFVAESDKVVQRLLESEFTVVSLLLPEKWLERFAALLATRPEEIYVYILEKEKLEHLTGFTFYQGVLAVGKIPPSPTLDDLLARSARPRLFAAVEGLTNAENLGGLVRNAAAFGVQALLVDQFSTSPYLRRAVRGSMGTIFRMPVLEKLDLARTMPVLQSAGLVCIAAHPHAGMRTLPRTDLTGECCVVFGSEGYGISPALLGACDQAVAIPMVPGVDSLNVGSAAAAFLYEAYRQRSGSEANAIR
jgi:tRNA G18 (ribose-2'-O)-methylase SpoU